jgi:hypothetical protein
MAVMVVSGTKTLTPFSSMKRHWSNEFDPTDPLTAGMHLV